MNRLLLRLAAPLAVWSFTALSAPAKPLRLFEIFAIRVVADVDTGQPIFQRGMFDSAGIFRVFELTQIPPGATVPPAAWNHTLITLPTWYAYDVLGTEALANFEVTTTLIEIGSQGYYAVRAADDAKFDLGDVVNLSTRAVISPGGEPMIAGFVVDERHRRVLIRGVGPSLAAHGVTAPLADPFITVYTHGSNQAFAFNDDWGQRYDADEIEQVAATVGAFPLPRDSKDAAYLLELPPGVYTVHLTDQGGGGGTALVEVYVVP